MNPRCDITVFDAVARYCCDNRSDSVRHVAAQTLKKVCDNDWVAQNGRLSTNCLHDYMLTCLHASMLTFLQTKTFLRLRGHPRAILHGRQNAFEVPGTSESDSVRSSSVFEAQGTSESDSVQRGQSVSEAKGTSESDSERGPERF